jgi:hypothetical protein
MPPPFVPNARAEKKPEAASVLAPLAAAIVPKTKGLPLKKMARDYSTICWKKARMERGEDILYSISTDIGTIVSLWTPPQQRCYSLGQYQKRCSIPFDTRNSRTQTLWGPSEGQFDDERSLTSSNPWPLLKFLRKPLSLLNPTLYKIDDDGLVYEQDQTWSKSGAEALQESFTPTLFTLPPALRPAPPSLDLPVSGQVTAIL